MLFRSEPTGRFTLWSLRNGERLLEQNLPPIEHVTHFVLLRDRERWLLLTHVDEPLAPDKSRPRVSVLYLDHWSVHGPAFAFDRATGKQLWTAMLDWQGVQAAQPADSPALMLAARVHNLAGLEQRPGDFTKFDVSVLDKRTGIVLSLESGVRPDRNAFADIRPNFADKIIEIQIERNLHRLTFETTR